MNLRDFAVFFFILISAALPAIDDIEMFSELKALAQMTQHGPPALQNGKLFETLFGNTNRKK